MIGSKLGKFVLIIMLTLCGLLVGLAVSLEWLTVNIANRYLSEYNTQIERVTISPKALNHWSFEQVAFQVYDSQIIIKDIEIKLKPGFYTEQLDSTLIQEIRLGTIDVLLGQTFLADEDKNTDEQGAAFALNLEQLPLIDIGAVNLQFQGLPESELSLVIERFKLDPQGQLHSQIKINQKELLGIHGKLQKHNWQLHTKLDFAAFPQVHSEYQLPQTDVTLTPLLNKIRALQTQYAITGKLESSFELGLKTGVLTTAHRWSNASLTLKEFDNLTLQPQRLVSHSATPSKGQQLSSEENALSFTFGGHLADLSFKIEPLAFTLIPSEKQRQNLLRAFAPAHQQDLNQLVRRVFNGGLFKLELPQESKFALTEERLNIPKLTLSAFENNYSAQTSHSALNHVALHFDEITIDRKQMVESRVEDKESDSTVPENTGAEHKSTSANHYRATANWQFKTQFSNLAPIQHLWPTAFSTSQKETQQHMPHLAIPEIAVNASGRLSVNTSNNEASATRLFASVSLNKASSLQLANISIKKSPSEAMLAAQPGLPHQSIFLDSFTLHTLGKLQYKFDQQHQLEIPPLQLQLDNLDVLSADSQENTGQRFQLLEAALKLEQSNTLAFETLSRLKERTQIHPWQNQLSMKASSMSLRKFQRPAKLQKQPEPFNVQDNSPDYLSRWLEQHKASPLFRLDTFDLKQTLNWNGKQLRTQEKWQLSLLPLSSQHLWEPDTTSRQWENWKLTGNMSLATTLTELQALLNQNIELNDAWYIDGEAQLSGSYAIYSQPEGQSISFDFIPSLSQAEGSIELLPFSGVDFSTHCSGYWHSSAQAQRRNAQHMETKVAKIKSNAQPSKKSTLHCQQLRVDIQAFNPGTLITETVIEGTTSIAQSWPESATDGDDKQAQPKDFELNSLDANIKLTANGHLLDGTLLIPIFDLNLHAPSTTYMVLQGINLQQVMQIQPQQGVYADGIFDGVLPTTITGGKFAISGGKLVSRAPGGVIKIDGNPAVDEMRRSQPHLDFAFSTLEHLDYHELSSTFDMTRSGDATLKVQVKGTSPNVERPIHFNYSQEENMLQLMKSLQIGDKLQQQIEQSVQ
ncbi:YdbH domain-containing protein [Shewanella gelidii]|uniref:C4-dicarboxylate ABC transporter n=1 Tax=Shewanella gelidii TaxID=1642821 RepID=A0A917JQS0_9GAMM|nr:YdbH domain-containing protein [Shewanella gelidii]MCL1099467.1 YdbH domain-containing protein [Shewanella gelidii]GGI77230.1 C4-dicarboxylate ABC transporter [Shewanella gelidii]